MTDIMERLLSDRQFYEREYKTAKSRAMALVAFGAYMALVKLLEEKGDAQPLSEMKISE